MKNINLGNEIDNDFLAHNFSAKLGVKVSNGVKRLSKAEKIIRRELRERNELFKKQLDQLRNIQKAPVADRRQPSIMHGYRNMISKDTHWRING